MASAGGAAGVRRSHCRNGRRGASTAGKNTASGQVPAAPSSQARKGSQLPPACRRRPPVAARMPVRPCWRVRATASSAGASRRSSTAHSAATMRRRADRSRAESGKASRAPPDTSGRAPLRRRWGCEHHMDHGSGESEGAQSRHRLRTGPGFGRGHQAAAAPPPAEAADWARRSAGSRASCRGGTRSTFASPANPLAGSRWPILDFTLPRPTYPRGRAASPRLAAWVASASFSPSTSVGSPSSVPVPCASTYAMSWALIRPLPRPATAARPGRRGRARSGMRHGRHVRPRYRG